MLGLLGESTTQLINYIKEINMSDKFVDKFNIMGIPVQIKDKNLTDTVNNTLTPKVTTLEGKFPR